MTIMKKLSIFGGAYLLSIIIIQLAYAQFYFSPSYSPNFFTPFVNAPSPDFSGYIWTSPTTAYKPNPASGGGIMSFVSYPEEEKWQSPYYQQTGYNFDNPFSGYGFPYNGLSSYPYNVFGGYGQPFSNNWFNPWQQPYQNYTWGLSYPFGGYSWNPFTPQFSNYSGWFNPWQSWTSADDCSGDGIYGGGLFGGGLFGGVGSTGSVWEDGWIWTGAGFAPVKGSVIDKSKYIMIDDYHGYDPITGISFIS